MIISLKHPLMKNKFPLAVALYVIFLLTTATMCDCGDFPNSSEVVDINVSLCDMEYNDNENYFSCFEIIDSVAFDRFAISIEPEINYYFGSRLRQSVLTRPAYACSPAPPVMKDTIDSLYIYTNKNYDASHPAGSDLKDVFDAVIFYLHSSQGNQRMTLTEFITNRPVFPNGLHFVLTSPPDSSQYFSFTFKLYTAGRENRIFEITTDSVIIKK